MKEIYKCLFLLAVVACFSGCAYFGNEKQYDEGNWYSLAGSQEVAKIKEDKLAFKKLENAPVQTQTKDGVIQGYKGVVANLSPYRINVEIYGPEKVTYFLDPNDKREEYLIPGNYVAYVYVGSRLDGNKGKAFPVSPKIHHYRGEDVHWFVVYDPYSR